ncbi:MAG: 6-phosphofructokinase [Bacteroidetes bacterium 4572_117]|nr:MAG: 6-phosphofructokinase [Bacteroidetes bacterium 4572_117]
MDRIKKIGILTAGGDCPGLNAAIRAVCKPAILQHGIEVVGIASGFLGLLEKDYIPLTEDRLSGILTLGGTILGTSREKPFRKKSFLFNEIEKPQVIKNNYEELGLDCLVCIGGNGTQKTAYKLSQLGINVIGLPKTIDNDIWGTEACFGFDSAVGIATDAIDRLHTTANSHRRVMVIEVMGHKAGWIALHSGIAGGGDIILLPEIDYREEIIADFILKRAERNIGSTIVVVAEGIRKPSKMSAGTYISNVISGLCKMESRGTVLGYIQRGGTPSAYDRIIATRYGTAALDLIINREFGKMVALKNDQVTTIDLEQVESKLRLVTPDHKLIKSAKSVGTCFGQKER